MKGTRLPMAAYIDLAEAAGAQIATPIAAWANPSGPVDGKAYDRICELICDEVAKGCDAVFLDLHGAMVVADRTDDGEGTLLEKIRAVAPQGADRGVARPARQRHRIAWCATATSSPATRPIRTWISTSPATSPAASCCAR